MATGVFGLVAGLSRASSCGLSLEYYRSVRLVTVFRRRWPPKPYACPQIMHATTAARFDENCRSLTSDGK